MKQTSVEHIGRSQLIPGVRRTWCRLCSDELMRSSKNLRKALRLYEAGHYGRALPAFEHLASSSPSLRPQLRHYLTFCRKWGLVSPRFDTEEEPNALYEATRRVRRAAYLLWLPTVGLLWPLVRLTSEDGPGLTGASGADVFRIALGACLVGALFLLHTAFRSGLFADQRRCKYCGRYTSYISPNHGLAYLGPGENSCGQCGRSYPMPSAQWDTEEGMRYMYERGSVPEATFYLEFEALYPGTPRSESAKAVLESQKRGRQADSDA